MKKFRHFLWTGLLTLILCLSLSVSGVLAAELRLDAEGTAVLTEIYELEQAVSQPDTASQIEQDGVIYSLSGASASVVGYTKNIPSACVIPERITVDGLSYTITEVADSAFYNCSNLVTMELPDTVTSIGARAFSGCIRLTSFTIPSGVTLIGRDAFSDCAALTAFRMAEGNGTYSVRDGVLFEGTTLLLYPRAKSGSSYTVPNGTSEIGGGTFNRCNLVSITLPDTVTEIGWFAFEECENLETVDLGHGLQSLYSSAFSDCVRLQAISLPASIQTIDDQCFRGTDRLTAIEVAEGCERYFDDQGVLYGYGTPDDPNSTELILYAYPAGKPQTSYSVREGTVQLLNESFWDAGNLAEIHLPNSLTSIGSGAFTDCGLTSISIPDSVTEIGHYTFQNCSLLASVSLGSGITVLPDGLFHGCTSLTAFRIPKQVTSISNTAFELCHHLEAFSVEEGSESYSAFDGALYNAAQTELLLYPSPRQAARLEIPATVTRINYGALSGCDFLETIVVQEGNPVYYDVDGVLFERTGEQDGVAYGNSLHTYPRGRTATSYTVPENVQTIAESAFRGNEILTEIDLSEVTRIREDAFMSSYALRQVTGEHLSTLEYCALFGTSLPHITLPAAITSLDGQCLDYCYELEYIEFLGSTPPEADWFAHNSPSLRYVYVPEGTSVAYKAALTGSLNPGAMIVEGRYVPEETVSEMIDNLTAASPVADVNAAAAGCVRLLSGEADKLSDAQLCKVDDLFQAAHKDTLSVTVSSTSGNVAVQGAAVASGLVEAQTENGTVSGTVAIRAEEQTPALGELLHLDFTMMVNEAETELQAPVLVQVTLPEGLRDKEFFLVHRDDWGWDMYVDYTREGDTVSFRADSFSSYVFLAAGVSYAAQEDGVLYLASYLPSGQMVSIEAQPVAAGEQGVIAVEPKPGIRYQAFVLNRDGVPVGSALTRLF